MNLMRFTYCNWRGDTHAYVIEPEGIELKPVDGTDEPERHWVLHGNVVSRDGDPREDMGENRRRTFMMAKIQNIQREA